MSYFKIIALAVFTAILSATAQPPLPSTTPHVNQFELLNLVRQGQAEEAFERAEDSGDVRFSRQFLRTDGIGANVENGNLFIFTRVPRADLKGPGEWFNHFPPRTDGPNGQSCVACHNQPVEDGGGTVVSNINRDPFREGILGHFNRRNAPHVMGMAGPQLLAEEMTAELKDQRADAIDEACHNRTGRATEKLTAKDVFFGFLTVIRASHSGEHAKDQEGRYSGCKCKVTFDNSQLAGIDSDLVIKPFQWKGTTRFVREFNRGAAHTEMGMQPVELLHTPDEDGDFDGIIQEMSVGDMTALAIYNSAQPRPVTRLELDDLGLDSVSAKERKQILRGADRFEAIGCAVCHVPRLTVKNVIFREPSRSRDYRDSVFPAGQNPLAAGLDPAFPVSFNITRDQPDNIIRNERGKIIARLGSFQTDNRGRALIDLYSDLKRHDLGDSVSEVVDETASPVPAVPGTFQGGVGRSVFLTRPLWGVGSTAPYMHDGNSTTLTEAISRHGNEAADSRARFQQLSDPSKEEVIAFLNSLVLFKLDEEEEGAEEQAGAERNPGRKAGHQPTDKYMHRMR